MQSISVLSTETVIVTPGNVAFIHIYNNGAETIFLKFDGDSANALTVANGWPVPSGAWFSLNNDGNKPLFNKGMTAICAAGPVDARIQGA